MKLMAVIRLNSNFVGECNTTADGERYVTLRHKFGLDIQLLNQIFKDGYVRIGAQIIPVTSIGSIILVEDK